MREKPSWHQRRSQMVIFGINISAHMIAANTIFDRRFWFIEHLRKLWYFYIIGVGH